MPDQVVFRHTTVRLLGWAAAVGFLCFGLGCLVAAFVVDDPANKVRAGVLCLLTVPLAIRATRLRVVASPAGVSVFNFLGTQTLPWSQVASFEFSRPSCALVRSDGTRLAMSAIQPARATAITGRRSTAADNVDSLNELLRRWRA